MRSEWNLIHTYTRAEALADGVLIDATELSRQAGFKIPVALTCAAWERCVAVPPGTEDTQDATGRLWDVLFMCRCGIRAEVREASEFRFGLSVVSPRGSELVMLKALIGPDDDGGPCLTIMLPEED